MNRVYISNLWHQSPGHSNFSFVDIAVNADTKLFIDPCLLRKSARDICQQAQMKVDSFFDSFYEAYKVDDKHCKEKLLCHAGEQNATKFGYGNGSNGKGNTTKGILKDLQPLEELIIKIPTISQPEDLTVLLPNFAEDGLSDLLTNIIHDELSKFTLSEMGKFKIASNGTVDFFYWDSEKAEWRIRRQCGYFYNHREILLVPKEIVRPNYLFSTGQLFSRIIIERIRAENGLRNSDGKFIPKKEVMKIVRQQSVGGQHWKYEATIPYLKQHNDVLDEYHRRLPSFYTERGNCMTDTELDNIVYY